MITLHQVNFGKDFFAVEVRVEVGEGSDRIFVICGHSVDSAVIATDSPPAAGGGWRAAAWAEAWLFGDH